MRALMLGVIAATGCSFHPNGATGDGSGSDAGHGSDAQAGDALQPDTPNTGFCAGTLIRVCTPTEPVDVTLTGQIDTTPGSGDSDCIDYPQPNGGPHVCVIYGNKVTADTLQVSGSRPLVIAAYTDLEIPKKIDVASRTADGRLGAGADDGDACDGGNDPVAGMSGGGGGAGGSYGGAGGAGGVGIGGFVAGGTALTGHASAMIVRGGCAGRKGAGNLAFSTVGGDGGHSGGAVLLVANGMIHIGGAGLISAGGTGGGLPTASSGGGGGGGASSGGWIGFDAGTMTKFDGQAGAFANGGGGSPGDQVADAGNPTAGQDAKDSANPAPGGTSPNGMGNGGDGAAQGGAVDGHLSMGAGGGGGGGGAGMIVVVHGTLSGGTFSPSVSQ